MQVGVVGEGCKETVEEEEEAVGCGVVPSSVDISTVEEDGVDPFEIMAKLVASVVFVKEGEGVDADDGVHSWTTVVEVSLFCCFGVSGWTVSSDGV